MVVFVVVPPLVLRLPLPLSLLVLLLLPMTSAFVPEVLEEKEEDDAVVVVVPAGESSPCLSFS